MTTPLKVGDTLYAIYEGFREELEVQRAVVQAVSSKEVRLGDTAEGNRTDLAFHCRVRFSLKDIERYGRTEQEAWGLYAGWLTSRIDRGEQELVELRKQYHVAVAREKAVADGSR